MSNSDLIMESLDEIYPHAYCDDCLATELNIRPRQQINQLGNKLSIDGKIIRQKGICSLCKKQKITNSITRNPSPAQEKKSKVHSRECNNSCNVFSIPTLSTNQY